MLLKKPYALLIKHFKLLHVILAILTFYSIYKMNSLLNFFNNYLNIQNSVVGQKIRDTLYNNLMFVVPIVIFLMSILLLVLMTKKRKPFFFYLFNTITYFIILIAYIFVFTYLKKMETGVVDIIGVRAIRDILTICIAIQGISLIVTFVRATGFDIKNFEFKTDLQELEISEEDLEEYEIDFSFDSNEGRRKRKRKRRYLKYAYQENKFLVNLVIIIIVIFVAFFFIQGRSNIYTKTNMEGNIISDDNYSFSIIESYLTNTGYNGLKITDDYLVITKIKVKVKGNINYLLKNNFVLQIGNTKYTVTNYFDDYVSDLGISYDNNILSNDYNNYLLVFDVPKEKIESKMTLLYINEKGTVKVKLNPQKINTTEKKYNLGETFNFDENNKIQINDYEIKDRFDIYYDFCIKDNCYNSVQYLVPRLDSNYDKAIIKIDGSLFASEGSNFYDLNQLIKKFALIYYKQDGTEKSSVLIPIDNIKKNDKNIYYYEIKQELLNADNITLVFRTRKCKYSYSFK